MLLKNSLKFFVKWTVPSGFVDLVKTAKSDYKLSKYYLSNLDGDLFPVLKNNSKLKDIKKGKRCFILGTGPSINKQNIKLLENEECIFLSQFYLHQDYNIFKNKYHMISGIVIHDKINNDLAVKYYRQIEEKISSDNILFLNYLDCKFIQQNNLLKDRDIFYFSFRRNYKDIFRKGIDASNLLYNSAGILTMAIQAAIYMGFKEIYILGFDYFAKGNKGLDHFYSENLSLVDHLSLTYSEEDNHRSTSFLLDQLSILKNYADFNSVKIINSSYGSGLKLLDKVTYEELF